MIPFERETSLTDSEERAREILEANWQNVVRATPGIVEDLKQRYSETAERVSENINEDCSSSVSQLFRPGVPDFLAFDNNGEYLFVEIKTRDDGIRSSQLHWLREFDGAKVEIWFMKSKEVEEELDSDSFGVYSFSDKMNGSENTVKQGEDGFFDVEVPKTLASAVRLEEGDTVTWRIKSSTELILDSK